jgi:hypothetical protein
MLVEQCKWQYHFTLPPTSSLPPSCTHSPPPSAAAGAVDTKQFEADADRMFDWDDVIMVDMRSSVPVQCPISLDSPPVCPQITPCGHVFSFGSIMRHLMTHGGEQLRRSAPCPLCYQPLVARELRLVQVRDTGCMQPPRCVTWASGLGPRPMPSVPQCQQAWSTILHTEGVWPAVLAGCTLQVYPSSQ